VRKIFLFLFDCLVSIFSNFFAFFENSALIYQVNPLMENCRSDFAEIAL